MTVARVISRMAQEAPASTPDHVTFSFVDPRFDTGLATCPRGAARSEGRGHAAISATDVRKRLFGLIQHVNDDHIPVEASAVWSSSSTAPSITTMRRPRNAGGASSIGGKVALGAAAAKVGLVPWPYRSTGRTRPSWP